MTDPKPFLEQLSREHQRDATPRRKPDRRVQFFSSEGGFQAAKRNRMTEEWNPGNLGPNSIHRMDGSVLRERARDLVLNNPMAKSAVDAYAANVVECGIHPKPKLASEEQRDEWTAAFGRWAGNDESEGEADITGQQPLHELAALWLSEVIVGGGCLLHFHNLPRRQMRGRRLPLTIELLPEERFAQDMDWTPGRNKKTANQIIGGIELDSATGRPVRYWVKPNIPNDVVPEHFDPIPLPASQCRYAFFRRRIGQHRGNTLLHAVVMHLWKLGYYTDNEMMSSAIKSCFTAMITTDNDDDGEWASLVDDNDATTDSDTNRLEKIQPGMIGHLRKGEGVQGVGPNVPGGDSTPWLFLIMRSIAIGAGLSYEELCRDYSQGNFSSTRAAMNADRKRYRPLQSFAVSHFYLPVYREFINAAVLAGLDQFPAPGRFAAEMDQWTRVGWRKPGWASVNPKDDAMAHEIDLRNAVDSRENIIGATGRDRETIFDHLEEEERQAERRNIPIRQEQAQADAQIEAAEAASSDPMYPNGDPDR
jgi:lambda family phage portal protein